MRGLNELTLFRIPAVKKTLKDPERIQLCTRRRQAWIRAIKRGKNDKDFKNWRVCSNHFISGKYFKICLFFLFFIYIIVFLYVKYRCSCW